eukprot:1145094-Pelagomonas_calceolata.AAC.1
MSAAAPVPCGLFVGLFSGHIYSVLNSKRKSEKESVKNGMITPSGIFKKTGDKGNHKMNYKHSEWRDCPCAAFDDIYLLFEGNLRSRPGVADFLARKLTSRVVDFYIGSVDWGSGLYGIVEHLPAVVMIDEVSDWGRVRAMPATILCVRGLQ